MIVLGVDPGSNVTGYSFITQKRGRFQLLDAGCIRTNAKEPIPKRLYTISHGLEELILKYSPDTAAIESIFSGKSVQSALLLGQARGVALMTLGKYDLEVSPYHPMTVKKNVAGHGKAGKKEMIKIVSILLGLKQSLPSDAADATAIAITHLMHTRLSNKMRKI